MSTSSSPNAQKYFANLNEEYDATSLSTLSPRDKKILQIREKMEEAAGDNDWKTLEGVLLGVLFADPQLASDMIVWRSEVASEGTLLHDVLVKEIAGDEEQTVVDYTMTTTGAVEGSSRDEVPLRILEMMIDIAPSVLQTPNAEGWFPIADAICQLTLSGKPLGSSLEVVRFLAQADATRPRQSLLAKDYSPMQVCVWRQNVDICRYLLSFFECRESLLHEFGGAGRVPLWYASRDILDEEKHGNNNLQITPFLQLLIEATAEECQRQKYPFQDSQKLVPCCVVGAMEITEEYLFDRKKAVMVARRQPQKHCCDRHAQSTKKMTTPRLNSVRKMHSPVTSPR